MFFACLEELASYQEFKFSVPVSEQWVSFCARLRDYQAPLKGSFAIEKQRKWELVSAFQRQFAEGTSRSLSA
jgi:hypothetical protein